ncbi:hypothetical protein AAHE18_01G237700 [Arachis hypogaea]
MATKMINRTLFLTYFCLFIYILLSSGVILYNKWVLSPKYFNFPHPITLTMIHMGFSGAVAFLLIRILKVVSPVKMTFEIYATCVVPISAFFASSLWFGNTAYLHISVAFIQMLKALMPVATFVVAIVCGTEKASFVFLFVPWYLLEKPAMKVSQIQFNFWIFFSNALCALALNFSIFLVIGRTGAVTIRVAGVLKDWMLIALSTVIFPESTITGLNITGYAIALCGVVMYNYIKVKDVRASQQPTEIIPDRITKDWRFEKRPSDIYAPLNAGNNEGSIGGNGFKSDIERHEEAPRHLKFSSSS